MDNNDDIHYEVRANPGHGNPNRGNNRPNNNRNASRPGSHARRPIRNGINKLKNAVPSRNNIKNAINNRRKQNRNAMGRRGAGNPQGGANEEENKKKNNGGLGTDGSESSSESESKDRSNNKFRNDSSESSSLLGQGKAEFRKRIKRKIIIALIIALPIILFLIFLVAVLMAIFGGSDITGMVPEEELKCKDMIIVRMCNEDYEDGEERDPKSEICTGNRNKKMSKWHYKYTGDVEVDLEHYVGGVIAGEVGDLSNEEVFKAWAVIARTYAQQHVSSSCTIESSNNWQVFSGIKGDSSKYMKAAFETEGQVITDKNGDMMTTGAAYDMFACVDMREINGTEYYIVNQPIVEHDKIPKDFVDEYQKRSKMNKAFLICDGYTHQHHGRGASQLGAYYYATEKGFSYTDIIDYYYHDYVSGRVNSSNESDFSLFCNVNPNLECYDPNYNS